MTQRQFCNIQGEEHMAHNNQSKSTYMGGHLSLTPQIPLMCSPIIPCSLLTLTFQNSRVVKVTKHWTDFETFSEFSFVLAKSVTQDETTYFKILKEMTAQVLQEQSYDPFGLLLSWACTSQPSTWYCKIQSGLFVSLLSECHRKQQKTHCWLSPCHQ